MMSLEMFNEHVLKGKSVEELYELIEDFKIEKAFLKVKIEEKNIADFTLPPQDMVAKINKYRLYIRDTYRQIEKIGGTIERADDEAFAIKFQENIPNIYQIDYQIGGYFEGNENYCLTFETDQVIVTKRHSQVIVTKRHSQVIVTKRHSHEESTVKAIIDKNTFLKNFSTLHIGEWRESYSDGDYGALVMDGTGWSLTIHYFGEIKSVEFIGSNAFPYNIGRFDRLCRKAFDK